jgi:hypothetical protein
METTVNPLLTQALPPEITISWIHNHSIYHALIEQIFQAFKQTSRRISRDTLLRAQAKNITIILEGWETCNLCRKSPGECNKNTGVTFLVLISSKPVFSVSFYDDDIVAFPSDIIIILFANKVEPEQVSIMDFFFGDSQIIEVKF